jgi:3-oxoacyl-(acyl-carrier-protein) synthase/pimeloyl-ACP methyl ester carboxylesterase/aryl carrier-like protein
MSSLDKIALVGMACRLPGANSLNEFWDNLLSGTVSTKKTRTWPDDSSATSGFIDNPNSFDAAFFNVSPNEAQCMSPQLRQLLEVSYQAIENSGLSVAQLAEWNTGVFCTSLPGDYKNLLAQNEQAAVNPYSFSGNAFSAISGRLSYFYDFHGPSVAIDTACSSGLTALHLAQLSIKNGDCEAALVGGASIFSTSEFHTLATSSHMLSKSNECAAFDEKADGFVASEGVICLVLISEKKAKELGLPVYGLIKEISLNHNGLSNGLMAPNAKQQETLIRKTYKKAGLTLNDIALFETHGTATKLGDSLELRGLTEALTVDARHSNCYLGASKMIIGHTLVCSALASVVKTALSYHYQIIPPNPLFTKVNPLLNIPAGLSINNQPVPWPVDKHYASISAYGFTGSNGHLIMEFVAGNSRAISQPFSFAKKDYSVQKAIGKVKQVQAGTKALQSCIEILCEVLSYQNELIDMNKSLAELGIDSLTALTVLNKLKERGYTTSADKVWSAASVIAFSKELLTQTHELPESEVSLNIPEIPGMRAYRKAGLTWLSSTNQGTAQLLLLPPLNSDYKAWLRQIPVLLKRDYQIHIPYYPGHDAHELSEPFVLENLAKKIAAFARSLDENPHFIGWSLGGILSILVAVAEPELMKSMSLIACTTRFDYSLFEKTVEMQDDLRANNDVLKIAFQTNQSISDYISCKTPMSILKDYYQELMNLSIDPVLLARIDLPTQIILGKQDPVINEQQIEHLKVIPHQALTVFEKAGHFIPITFAAEFNQLLTSFISSVE